ncbi:MAG: Protein translocase subunit SecE [Chlamydiales bacterium]|nr:Protein translocase subunit SecE [Chlamydiales bacterium]MCH9635298.1 Protein translocase subunit SecE [Chlamydiales bacterium]
MQGQKAIGRMEAKKKEAAKGRDLVNFASEVKQELKRVDWTTKEELQSYTKIVVVCIFLFGFSIYFVDLLLRSGLGAINFLVKWIVG